MHSLLKRGFPGVSRRFPARGRLGWQQCNTSATHANGTGDVYASNGNYVGSLSNCVALHDANAMKALGSGASYSIENTNVGLICSHTFLKNSQYFAASGFDNAGSGSDFKLDGYDSFYAVKRLLLKSHQYV